MKRNTLDWGLSLRLINAEGILMFENNIDENSGSWYWICWFS